MMAGVCLVLAIFGSIILIIWRQVILLWHSKESELVKITWSVGAGIVIAICIIGAIDTVYIAYKLAVIASDLQDALKNM